MSLLPTAPDNRGSLRNGLTYQQGGAFFRDGRRVLPSETSRARDAPLGPGRGRLEAEADHSRGREPAGETESPDGKKIIAQGPSPYSSIRASPASRDRYPASRTRGPIAGPRTAARSGSTGERGPREDLRLDVTTASARSGRSSLHRIPPGSPDRPILMTPDGKSTSNSYRRTIDELFLVKG